LNIATEFVGTCYRFVVGFYPQILTKLIYTDACAR